LGNLQRRKKSVAKLPNRRYALAGLADCVAFIDIITTNCTISGLSDILRLTTVHNTALFFTSCTRTIRFKFQDSKAVFDSHYVL
jgi:hypothetical protein